MSRSWFHHDVEKRFSGIQGRGLFARKLIPSGTIIAVKGGAIIDRSVLEAIRSEISPAEIQIEDDLFIAPLSADSVEENLLCLNHSCDPNSGVRGQITFVTLREVAAGEELTIDYAMIDGDPAEQMNCSCGTVRCRGIIRGNDWQIGELQQRYAGHFSTYLEARIKLSQRPRSLPTRTRM